jgi:adenylate cyclase
VARAAPSRITRPLGVLAIGPALHDVPTAIRRSRRNVPSDRHGLSSVAEEPEHLQPLRRSHACRGAEVDTGVLFADIRGSTALAEELGAAQFAALITRFYGAATRVITVEQQGWIDKFVGDELMALYIPAMGSDYRAHAVQSGVALLQAVGYVPGQSPWLPLAVGLHAGPAFVGKPGSDASSPVTALGDTVNATARIQAQAAAGELLMSEEIYGEVEATYPGLERRTLVLRGRQGTVGVRVLRPAEL